jgi:NAD(P)-dependent dehydrogenase (short-subunit alcohol dehydrogenase family)
MDLQLEGKKAVVTGGSRGIGKAIARQLAREGCDVVIGARTADTLNEAAGELASETKRKVVPVLLDTTNAESIDGFTRQAAEALGGIEILINNAARLGYTLPDDFDTVSDDLLISDFAEKTLGYFRCTRAAVAYMKQAGWGRVINIGGVTVRTPTAFSTPARNAAMVVMSKAAANALAPFGITVNVVHPGAPITERSMDRFRTRAAETGASVDEVMRQQADQQPMKRLVEAADLANLVVFLCSPLAFSVSGEAISAAGGQGPAVHL